MLDNQTRQGGRGNRASNSVTVSNTHLRRAGDYTVTVELLEGWTKALKIQKCKIGGVSTFKVKCSDGYVPETANRECKRTPDEKEPFGQICKNATVSVGSEAPLLQNGRNSLSLTQGTKMSVRLDNEHKSDAKENEIKLTPVALSAQNMTPSAATDITLTDLGTFDMQVVKRRTGKSAMWHKA